MYEFVDKDAYKAVYRIGCLFEEVRKDAKEVLQNEENRTIKIKEKEKEIKLFLLTFSFHIIFFES